MSANDVNVSDFDTSKFNSDLRKAFLNQRLCDCEFMIGNEKVGAHKIIIEKSAPYMAQQLDESGNKLTINNCSRQSLEEFFKFLYSGEMDTENAEIVCQVLSLAVAFRVPLLISYCEQILYDILEHSDPNVVFQNCHKYNLSNELKKKSFHMIQK